MLFDVRIGADFDGQVMIFQPVLAPLPLEPAVIDLGMYYQFFINSLQMLELHGDQRAILAQSTTTTTMLYRNYRNVIKITLNLL